MSLLVENQSHEREGMMIGSDDDENTVRIPIVEAEKVCLNPIHVLGVQSSTPLSWSADSLSLAFVSGDKSIFVFKHTLDSDKQIKFVLSSTLIGHKNPVKCLSFHPTDSNLLVSGSADGLFVWNVKSAKFIHHINKSTRSNEAHDSDVECLCWTHKGANLVTGGKDNDIKCWDALNGFKLLETVVGHKAAVLAVVYNEATERLASGGRDSTVKIWSANALNPDQRAKRIEDKGLAVHLEGNMDGQRGDICCIEWFENGKFLIGGGRDNSIMIYDAVKIVPLRIVKAEGRSSRHMGDVRKILIIQQTPPGSTLSTYYLLSCSLDSTYKCWQLNLAEELIAEEKDDATMAADTVVREAALLASFLSDKPLVDTSIVDVKDTLHITKDMHVPFGISTMAINKQLKLLATSSSECAVSIRDFRNILDPIQIQEFIGHSKSVNGIAILPGNGYVVSVSEDSSIHVYDIETMERKLNFSFGYAALCVCVSTSKDGKPFIFVGGSDYTVKMYAGFNEFYFNLNKEAYDRKIAAPLHTYEIAHFEGHGGKVRAIASSPDGSLIASGGEDSKIILWSSTISVSEMIPDLDRMEGKSPRKTPLQAVSGHSGHVSTLAFSEITSSGVYLVSGSNDHSLAVWKLQAGSLMLNAFEKKAHEAVISATCFGKRSFNQVVFSACWQGYIKGWTFTNGGLLGAGGMNQVFSVRAHDSHISCLSLTESGEILVSTTASGSAATWQITSVNNKFGNPDCLPLSSYVNANEAIGCGAAIVDSFFTGAETGTLRLWPVPKSDGSNNDFFTMRVKNKK